MIEYRGKILLLKRARNVYVNPCLWSPVAGRIEAGLSPEKQAYEEIYEETGIPRRKLRLIERGKKYVLQIRPSIRASVQPFLYQSTTRRVRLNGENSDYRSIKPTHLSKFKLIPKFDLTLKALRLL
jgi:8-oxo-dGTP pyrophosphatase MutT (NUDIX family)